MGIDTISSIYADVYTKDPKQFAVNPEQASDEKLMDVCKQFEAYFMEQMLKEMVKTIPVSEEVSGSSATLVDYYKDMMIQNVAAQSTEQNSLGLAQSLYEQMRRNYGIDDSKLPTV